MTYKKLVNTKPIISILQSQLEKGTTSFSQCEDLQEEISKMIQDDIDPNFKGTLQEILAYCKTIKESEDAMEHIKLNDLNLTRWIEELHLVMKGSEAVTIDYDQRKGREI
ncbi:YtzH-like family protein [Alkalihalobacterium sp. APHAB7]|uniref:YtzH-like family protein n=1 Tax=Alkalihalobacterium sp. APHAB7 TaxID=3402081 RepID=UPI003AAA36BA